MSTILTKSSLLFKHLVRVNRLMPHARSAPLPTGRQAGRLEPWKWVSITRLRVMVSVGSLRLTHPTFCLDFTFCFVYLRYALCSMRHAIFYIMLHARRAPTKHENRRSYGHGSRTRSRYFLTNKKSPASKFRYQAFLFRESPVVTGLHFIYRIVPM